MKYMTHSDVRGRNGYGLVLNVKCHNGFNAVKGGTDEQRQRAWDRAQLSWWNLAELAAKAMGFSAVYSCGRSGGYIYPVLDSHAITSADLDRTNGRVSGWLHSYETARARHIVGMMRKFRDYVSGAMASDNLAEMFADELAELIAEDTEEAAAQAAHDALPGRLADALRAMLDGVDDARGLAHAVLADYEKDAEV